MGQLCGKKAQATSNLIETEKEITLPSYKSDGDKYYDLQENKYNFLRKINFEDFLYSLVHFSNENATLEDDYQKANINFSMEEPFFCELFSNDIFQSFLENKILKHKAIYAIAGNDEKMTSIFKEGFLAANYGLGVKLAQNAKELGDTNADKNSIIKKGDAIAYGILFCVGANYVKIRALFNLFKKDEILKDSEKLDEFLLSLFIIAGYGMANARNKLSKFDEIGGIEKEKLKELINTSELKDSQNMVQITKKMLFGQDLSVSLNYQNFKDKFELNDKDNSLAFLLSPSGCRYMQQKNNV
jgi:hypothetical protein